MTLAQRHKATAGQPAVARLRRRRAVGVAFFGLTLLVAGAVWSLSIGGTQVSLASLPGAIFSPDTQAEQILRTIRLPRVVLAILAGASLAVAGAIMQAITNNPIAAPEIMGVNAGAVLMVVLSITVLPSLGRTSSLVLAFAGAAAAGITVLMLANSAGQTSPVRLALAGVTATALLASITQVLIVFHENSTDSVLFWLVGGVNYASWEEITSVIGWLAVGLAAAMALAPALNMLSLGEDMARGLGVNIERTRLLGAIVLIVLCGASVSVAGPVAFIGLVVPHIVRRLSGSNHWTLIPLSAVLGATLLVFSDNATRFIRWPYEEPAGVVTALIGAPLFVLLARRQGG